MYILPTWSNVSSKYGDNGYRSYVGKPTPNIPHASPQFATRHGTITMTSRRLRDMMAFHRLHASAASLLVSAFLSALPADGRCAGSQSPTASCGGFAFVQRARREMRPVPPRPRSRIRIPMRGRPDLPVRSPKRTNAPSDKHVQR